MINLDIGALVLVRQSGALFGPTIWVAQASDGNGQWSLIRKARRRRSGGYPEKLLEEAAVSAPPTPPTEPAASA
jgi:hypothetical protein